MLNTSKIWRVRAVDFQARSGKDNYETEIYYSTCKKRCSQYTGRNLILPNKRHIGGYEDEEKRGQNSSR